MNNESTQSAIPETTEETSIAQASSYSETHAQDSQTTPTSAQDFSMHTPSFETSETAQKMQNLGGKFGTLFVVSTPIGNNDDISLRALKVLKQADVVVGEEGKTVARLLHDHRITKKLEELNEHNENEQTGKLLQMLKNGKTLALVSDAGTPLLADPGAQLVRRAIDAAIVVRAIPGVTSIMTALTTSGLSMDSFVFAGFLSREPGERLQELKRLAQEPRTVALLETPYRLVPLLEAARQIIPQRRAYLGCNLTMDSETHHYGTVSELYTKFVVSRFKGEFVFCFEGAKGGAAPSSSSAQSRDSFRADRKGFGKGDFKREGAREGGFKREGAREGGFKREGAREGGFKREGAREGGFKREGAREGGFKREGAREGGKPNDKYARPHSKKRPNEGGKPQSGTNPSDSSSATPQQGE